MARTKFLLTEPTDYRRLAGEFQRLRVEAQWTQAEVAKKVGMSPSQYGRIERGEIVDRPSFDDIIRLARFYNISPNRAAQLTGLWPLAEINEVEDDGRIKAAMSYIAQMDTYQRNAFIEMFYRAAAANAGVREPEPNKR